MVACLGVGYAGRGEVTHFCSDCGIMPTPHVSPSWSLGYATYLCLPALDGTGLAKSVTTLRTFLSCSLLITYTELH
jgi:hypothetical protein